MNGRIFGELLVGDIMDPSTAIIAALVAGATTAAKDTASEALKDAYHGLRDLLSKHLLSLPMLEKKPTDTVQKAAAEELDESKIRDDPDVKSKAAALTNEIAKMPKDALPLSVDLEQIKAAGRVLVSDNVGGVRARNVEGQSIEIIGNRSGN